jgi:hypothetical protein
MRPGEARLAPRNGEKEKREKRREKQKRRGKRLKERIGLQEWPGLGPFREKPSESARELPHWPAPRALTAPVG